jgi:multidrug resistance efflux pump
MFRKYLLPILSACLLLFAILHVVRAQQAQPKVEPPLKPPSSPFPRTVAGAGLVEPRTENISMGTPLAGLVAEVHVKVGQKVKKGDVLFSLDDRQLRAERKMRQAALQSAEAQLLKLQSMPRKEEIPSAETRVAEAEANFADQTDQLHRARQLAGTKGVIAEEEVSRREQAARMAKEQLSRAKADLALLLKGAWEPDFEIASASVAQAEAQLQQTETDLDRLKVRASVDGEVLQVNVRPGEFVAATAGTALILLGDVHKLHVRVDIDEHDVHRFVPGAAARATLRGDPKQAFQLTFVRVEPYVIPKKSLTGDNTERVDTRVLQVIYAVETGGAPLYVGQQVDVFVEARKE